MATKNNSGGGNFSDGGGSSGGSLGEAESGGVGVTLKKGPWTAAEDGILMEYVRKHGEGNWNAVQRNSGLARCGKSCRLRWANHLRPNLKKGAFSPEEERLILELHAKYGNKWARMAAQVLYITYIYIYKYVHITCSKFDDKFILECLCLFLVILVLWLIGFLLKALLQFLKVGVFFF